MSQTTLNISIIWLQSSRFTPLREGFLPLTQIP